jgi:hypothetical protein
MARELKFLAMNLKEKKKKKKKKKEKEKMEDLYSRYSILLVVRGRQDKFDNKNF